MQLPALDQDSRNTGTAVWIFDIFSPAAWVAGPALYDRAAGSVGDLAAASRPAPGHGNKEQSRVSPPPGREHRLSSLQPGHCDGWLTASRDPVIKLLHVSASQAQGKNENMFN